MGGHPVSFERRKLQPHGKLYSVYDEEMLAMMNSLAKFRHYLVGSCFKVKTGHNNLRFFLEQQSLEEW